MADNERDFKGVWIPKEVWLDNRLSALDKVILTEIDSLDQSERGCFASNKHIADFCQCSETKVSKSVSLLIKLGYLYVQSFDGRQRELKSRLSNNANQTCKKDKADMKKRQESNTGTKTGSNTSKEKKERKTFDGIIAAYTSEQETTELLQEWLKVRKAKRAALTDRAIQMNIDKLDSLARESNMTVCEYLSEVIRRGWAAFYAIQNYRKQNGIEVKQERTDDLDDVF